MNAASRTEYLTYRFFGRPIFATPVSPRRLRRAALARFQPVSPRRAAFRQLMSLSMLVGADRLFCTASDHPIDPTGGFEFHRWMDQVRSELDEPEAAGVVFWNPSFERIPTDKRTRINVHLFDRAVRPVAFAKISFNESNDRRLENEAQTIRQLGRQGIKTFRFPRVLTLNKLGAHTYLLLEPLPESARTLRLNVEAYPRHCVAEYAELSRSVKGHEVEQLSWWKDYLESLDDRCAKFAEELAALIHEEVEVCRAHGDMQTSNVIRDGDQVWIFDWEDSRLDAPRMTDEIDFYMMLNYRKTLADPLLELRRFEDRYLRKATRQCRASVMMALAFRSTVCPNDALLFMQNWDKVR